MILIRISVNLSRKFVDALSCQHQSFCQVRYKSGTDCMRNANKCPKIPYSAMVKKMKKWSTRTSGHHQNLSLLQGHPLPMSAKFGRRPFLRSSVILSTEWQTEWSHNFHVVGGSNCPLARAMDGHIMRRGTIGSCQSAATSEIVKRCWLRVWLM